MLELKTQLSYADVDNLFQGRQHIHFITLKPPHDMCKFNKVIDLCRYLDQRNVVYWICPSVSPAKYEHYHGIISYPNELGLDELSKAHSAFTRKVNRTIGFNHPLQSVQGMLHVFNYIRKQRCNIDLVKDTVSILGYHDCDEFH